MNDKLWYDLVHTKYGDCYLCLYLARQNSLRKWVKILTLVFSTSGVLGWRIWNSPEAAGVSCILIAVVQLFHLIENQLIRSDSEMAKIIELRSLYLSHTNKLERLWIEFRADRVSEKQVTDEFFKLREAAAKMEALDTSLNIKQRPKLMTKAEKQAAEYFNQYHPN